MFETQFSKILKSNMKCSVEYSIKKHGTIGDSPIKIVPKRLGMKHIIDIFRIISWIQAKYFISILKLLSMR